MADATAPPPAELARIREFAARTDVPEAAKTAAVEAFSRQYPPPGTAPAAPAPTMPSIDVGLPVGWKPGQPPVEAPPGTPTVHTPGGIRVAGGGAPVPPQAPAPAEPPAPPETMRSVSARESLAERFISGPEARPEESGIETMMRGALSPTAGAVGAAAALAIPGLEGAGLLMSATRMAASVIGGVSMHALARFFGGTVPTTSELRDEAISDALPLLADGLVRPLILSPAEIESFTTKPKVLVGPRPSPELEPTKPALETPVKPGREPKVPPTVGVPEVAPGVEAGAMSPLPTPATPPTAGPAWTRATTDALKSTEQTNAALYDKSLEKAQTLKLSERTPKPVIDAARDAIASLDASNLDPQAKTAARKVLESIRDVEGEGQVEEDVPIVTRKGKEPVTQTSYADLDAWRQKLQGIAPSFEKVGTSQSFEQGSVGRVLGLVKDEMKRLASGTEVETFHKAAEDNFINEVQPMRKLTRAVFRGEAEPNQLVDTMTSKAHQQKFVRWMGMLDKDAPGLAQRVRTTKLQNMVEASTENGVFNRETFLKGLDNMPDSTRSTLLGGGERNDIAELLDNIERSRGTARMAQESMQKAADASHAQAQASHMQATSEYQAASARNDMAMAQYTREAEAVKGRNAAAQTKYAADLDAARAEKDRVSKKVAKRAMGLGLIGEAATLFHATHELLSGNGMPFIYALGGGSLGSAGLGWIASRPGAVKAANLLFKTVAAGGSPSAISRIGAQLVSHLVVGYGSAVLTSPAESHAGLPQTSADSEADSLARFSAAVSPTMQ